MIGLTTIVTATYNKQDYLPDAIQSVLSQTRPYWRWWIILDGANMATIELVNNLVHRDERVVAFRETVHFPDRKKFYRPSMLMNKYFPLINSDYFCWLSDDDVWEDTYLETLAGKLDENQDWDVVYGQCQVRRYVDGVWQKEELLGQENVDRYKPPIYRIDGGQILQTRRSYNSIGDWKFPTEGPTKVSDGLYMNELIQHHEFHRINKLVMTHRITPLSENVRATSCTK